MCFLNFSEFNFSAEKSYGFIAQDIEQILPELVSSNLKPAVLDTSGNVIHPAVSYKAVNYTELIAFLTKGIQEQQQKIDSLQSKTSNRDSINTALQSNNIALQNQVNQLVANGTSIQNQLNQLLDAVNNCCSATRSMQIGSTNAQSEPLMQTDVKLRDGQALVLQNYDLGTSVSTDTSGNILLTGTFINSFISFGIDILINTGADWDFFIIKFTPSGTPIWSHVAGGTSGAYGEGVCTDIEGNIYTIGEFEDPTITFGSNTLNNFSINNNCAGNYCGDIFIVKYNSEGVVVWAKEAGGWNSDFGHSISVDIYGNIFASGYFWSPSIIFGNDTLANNDNSGLTGDIFIAKLGITNGITKVSIKNTLTIYPNPSASTFTIQLPTQQNFQLSVIDITGKIVYANKNATGNITVDCSGFSSGIYFVKATNENMILTGKLIRE